MPNMVVLGAGPLSIEDVVRVAREGAEVRIAGGARSRIANGRARLVELLARGERIYGVNTGVGGNVGISLAPEADGAAAAQHGAPSLLRHRRSRCRATWSAPPRCCASPPS